ncbi:hypothetical protein Q1M62_14555 (plasmid) [Sinorhizobium meliloti]|nr:hypothetical protein Q1M62_14555 [Sinorhizobium meliloti]
MTKTVAAVAPVNVTTTEVVFFAIVDRVDARAAVDHVGASKSLNEIVTAEPANHVV